MMSRCFGIVVRIVRAWTCLYTWRMEPELRDSRRAEIESDLWEYEHDSICHDLNPTFHVLARLLIGIPSDCWWRVEQAALADPTLPRRTVVIAAAAIMAALWIVPVWLGRTQVSDRTRVNACGSPSTSGSTGSLTRADYRMRVITCAGAFFARRESVRDGQ
jgi:hypothetical protein